MKFIRKKLDDVAPLFEHDGKFSKLHPLYEAQDTILFTPGLVTKGASHVRDALDQKRMMIMVVIALFPCVLMAMYNTGYGALSAIGSGAATALQDDWHTTAYEALNLGYDPTNLVACFIFGALFFVPVWITGLAVGGLWEALFAVVRKHPITEGFLVTSTLFPLILPATIPLWQVALGITFGVVIGKEIFGGVGMNVLNPALTARAFLFFAYPAQISGDAPWLPYTLTDGTTGATALSNAYAGGMEMLQENLTWNDAFLGFMTGSMGETSALACLIGAVVLIGCKIGSWRTMLGCVAGTFVMATILNVVGSDTNQMFAIPFHWHIVIGGWMFGMVFMATDPVSSPFTEKGKLIYGFFIGVIVIIVRCINPAYAEGMMLSILFMNMFAPLIDHFFIQANIKRRMQRNVV